MAEGAGVTLEGIRVVVKPRRGMVVRVTVPEKVAVPVTPVTVTVDVFEEAC